MQDGDPTALFDIDTVAPEINAFIRAYTLRGAFDGDAASFLDALCCTHRCSPRPDSPADLMAMVACCVSTVGL